ncbi:M24 family metallopeptidase [bacterium]|nr:MAG: M24 family metallopeptidase [bacterium]
MRYTRLPASVFEANRARLSAMLPEGALAIVSANDVMPTNADGTMGFVQNSDLYYLTGVDQEETVLVLFPSARDPKKRAILFVRETSELIAIWEGAKLTKAEAREVTGIETIYWTSDLDRHLRDLLFEADTIYLNLNQHLRAASDVQTRERRLVDEIRRDYPLHPLKKLAPMLYGLRMVKSPEELEALREATRTTDAGFRRLLAFVKPGVQEFEVEAEMMHEYLRRRSRGFSYPPIIASGKNACVLHYVENNATCEDGDLLLLDCAAEYANYRSDMTRTIPVNGKFTERQRAVYDAVLRILKFTVTQLRPGVLPKEVQKAVEKEMENELIGLGLVKEEERATDDYFERGEGKPAFRNYFMHGVSHQIGIDVHDVNLPWVPLAVNMIVTVEPGIYIREENLAVRLENLIVIGETENEDMMANTPLEADEIEALMNA